MLDFLKAEREKVEDGGTSEVLDLLISRKWLDLFGPFTSLPRDIAANPIERGHEKAPPPSGNTTRGKEIRI